MKMDRLMGDNYFNPAMKKWSKQFVDTDRKPLERAFNMSVLIPSFFEGFRVRGAREA